MVMKTIASHITQFKQANPEAMKSIFFQFTREDRASPKERLMEIAKCSPCSL
jgi:hypothetical protein